MNLKQFNFSKLKQYRRIVIYLAVAFVGVLLWDAWMKEHPKKSVEQNPINSGSVQQPAPSAFVPPSYSTVSSPSTTTTPPKNVPISPTSTMAVSPHPSSLITVKTDVLQITIDLHGGNLVEGKLLKYDESLDEPRQPMTILSSDPNRLYLAQTGLKQDNAHEVESINFQSQQTQYNLSKNEKNLSVVLTGKTSTGLDVTKTFTFENDRYNIQVNYLLKNLGTSPWIGNIYKQIVRRDVPVKGSAHSRSYNGAAISSPDKPYEKLPFKKLKELQIDRNVQGGWVGMQEPYFLTAWIPDSNQFNHFYSSVFDNTFTIGYVGPQLRIEPGASEQQQSQFYIGPEIAKYLKGLGKGLDLTIDYGWLWMISKIIFWVMDHVNSVVKNWGWSIVITTLIIKLLFYKLSEKSYVSMAKMREIQPRLQALKERFGDDKQAFSKATMDFYKSEKINPLGGCLPTIVQIPVFIALYYVLIESVQLRQAPFIFWIRDLSVQDPYYVLPILMGVSMFLQQRLSPPPPDPMQAKMMMFLPVIFTIFFLTFPAGLVLYWLVNQCASILQQWYIMKVYHEKHKNKYKVEKKTKRSKKNKN